MKNKTAQAATEFIILIGMAFFFLIFFIIIATAYAQEALEDERQQAILELGYTIQEELYMISTFKQGLQKQLNIPQTLGNFNYEISTQEDTLTIRSANNQQTFLIPEITGTIQKGDNTIQNNNNEIIISQ